MQKTLDNGEALRTILTLVDNSGGFDYQVTDGTALVLQGLQDARKFIDSIPADDIKMVQAAALGMQLATGGPAKIVLGYAVAMAAKALVGDKIEATKALVSEEVAAFLQSGALSSDEYKALNCPNGDCSDKYASAGSYAINMDKDNVKFGLNIIIGVVGAIVDKAASKTTHRNPLTAKKGDVIATPDKDRSLFESLGGGRWQHKKSGAIYEKSTSGHTDKVGEWKVGLKKGQDPFTSKKITVGHDGKVLKIDK